MYHRHTNLTRQIGDLICVEDNPKQSELIFTTFGNKSPPLSGLTDQWKKTNKKKQFVDSTFIFPIMLNYNRTVHIHPWISKFAVMMGAVLYSLKTKSMKLGEASVDILDKI